MATTTRTEESILTKDSAVNVQEVSPNSPSTKVCHEWKPGYAARFPYVSAISLTAVLGLLGAMIGVLLASDEKNVDTWCANEFRGKHWKIQVNVWLSAFNFFAGKLLALAFAEAVTIAWWVKAMDGRTLKQLNTDFKNGRSIVSILLSPTSFGFIALGTIAFTLFSGVITIMQKATSTTGAFSTQHGVALTSLTAVNIPLGFSASATSTDPSGVPPTLTSAFREAARGWIGNSEVNMPVQGCPHGDGVICNMNMQGVGFAYSCTTRNPLQEDAWQQSLYQTSINLTASDDQFVSDNTGITGWKPFQMQLQATWYGDCKDQRLTEWQCVMQPALVNYPVMISNDTLTLLPATGSVTFTSDSRNRTLSPAVDEVKQVLSYIDLTNFTTDEGFNSTLGGIQQILNSQLSSYYNDNSAFNVPGIFGRLNVNEDWANACSSPDEGPLPEPITQMVNSVRDLMFRSSIVIASQNVSGWVNINQFGAAEGHYLYYTQNYTDTAGSITSPITIYKTDILYLTLGAALMVLCVACVVPLFWGYWRLGRKVSLSPFELAQALHTPSLQVEREIVNDFDKDEKGNVSGSNATSDELVELIGDVKIRYGEVAPGKLGMAVQHDVAIPQKGTFYN